MIQYPFPDATGLGLNVEAMRGRKRANASPGEKQRVAGGLLTETERKILFIFNALIKHNRTTPLRLDQPEVRSVLRRTQVLVPCRPLKCGRQHQFALGTKSF